MAVDLDRFKQVNDTLGHKFGDQLLREAGERIRRIIRAEDTAARFGADEYVLMLRDMHDPSKPARSPRVSSNRSARPMSSTARVVLSGASVGVALGADAWRRVRRTAAQRRSRALQGQAGRQGPVPFLRGGAERRRAGAAADGDRPARGAGAGWHRGVLPTGRRCRHRRHRRLRGAGALAPAGARLCLAGRFHSARRRNGPDRAAGRSRAAQGLSGRCALACFAARFRQSFGAAVSRRRPHRPGRQDSRRDRLSADAARIRNHRIGRSSATRAAFCGY